MQKLIPIVLATNRIYLDYSIVLLTSILTNSSDPSRIIFHLFTREDESSLELALRTITDRYQAKIVEHLIPPSAYRGLPAKDYKSLDAYSRLFAPRLLGHDYPKLLYLDIDMVVRTDIAELFDTDLSGHTLGAVRDLDYELGEGISPLFNSGLLLIDTVRWHDRGIEEQVMQEIRHGEGGFVPLADQDDLNIVLKKDWLELDPLWNVMCRSIYVREIKYQDSLILHFNGGTRHKPDHPLCINPGKVEYFRYLSIARSSLFPTIYFPILLSRFFLAISQLQARIFRLQ